MPQSMDGRDNRRAVVPEVAAHCDPPPPPPHGQRWPAAALRAWRMGVKIVGFAEHLARMAEGMRNLEEAAFLDFGGLLGPVVYQALLASGEAAAEAKRRSEVAVRQIATHVAEGLVSDSDGLGPAICQALATENPQTLKKEMLDAAATQRRIVDRRRVRSGSMEVAFRSKPAWILNGDFHDAIDLGGGKMLIAVGDAVGKGTAAALYAALTLGALRAKAGHCSSPSELAHYLNDLLLPHTGNRDSVSLCIAVWEGTSSRVGIANAGLPYPLVVHAGEIRALPVRGLPLGWFPHAAYEEGCAHLHEGDVLAIRTDGVSESANVENSLRTALEDDHLPLEQKLDLVMGAAELDNDDDQTVALIQRGTDTPAS